ncbi:hypothetical protein P879_05538 [Paragonimus westermani]|uniref:Uncharacterized protein n=1 Tax=Paragonimus westermani TaxID=34504 RepID=A0A8T0D3S3_9TREM|nr:hypothetical protein P879_05538 [Paragonimus westermani]
MLSELEKLRDEAISNQHRQMELERANAESSAKIAELNALLEARSRRLKELETFVEEKKSDLAEYERLKLRSEELETKTKNFEDFLKLEENRISTSKGIGHLTRLELDYERLKTTYKKLSKERAEWLITKEENSELIKQVEHLKNWRQRALNAENALAEMQNLEISIQSPLVSANRVSATRLYHLERENELLLAEHGRLRSKIADLQMELDGRPNVQEVLPQPSSTPHSWKQSLPAHIPTDKIPSICELEQVVALR